MRQAIKSGNEASLADALGRVEFWESRRNTPGRGSPAHASETCSQSARAWPSLNSAPGTSGDWRSGCSTRALDMRQVYRGEQPKWEPGNVRSMKDRSFPCGRSSITIEFGIWPAPGNEAAFSIPFGPWLSSCHPSSQVMAPIHAIPRPCCHLTTACSGRRCAPPLMLSVRPLTLWTRRSIRSLTSKA